MHSHARLLVFAAVFLCFASSIEHAQSPGKTKKEPVVTVSGTVTIKGKPAPGIGVGLRLNQPDETSPTFKATTDEDGIYHLKDVPAGSYLATPLAPAFVSSSANTTGQMVIVTGNENVDGVDFDLVRGGAITGRITDAEGHPLVEERVSLTLAEPRNQRPQDYPVTGAQTDDRGIYRMFGIQAGRYKVYVGEGPSGSFRGAARGRPTLKQTFYLDSADPAKPAIIDIGEGTEATKIDIAVEPPVQGFSASGRIVDSETGKPRPGIQIGLSRIITIDSANTSSYGGPAGITSDAQGEFRISNLQPGKYAVAVYFGSDSDLRINEPVTFEVVDQDVTGLLVKTSTGASVTGMVVFEGAGNSTAALFPGRMYISVYMRSEDNRNSTSGRGAPVRPDGSFHVGGLVPGLATFSIDTARPVSRFTISRIERNGIVQPNPIQIQEGEQIGGVRLFVTANTGSIRGSVRIANGTLPSGGRLMVQLIKSDERNTPTQGAETDSRGHFLIEHLGAGTYQLSVFVYLPESPQRPMVGKQTVTVNEGAATDVTITVDQNPNP